MQTWELVARIGAAYLIIGLILASVWTWRRAVVTTGQPASVWHKLFAFGIAVLFAPLILIIIALFSLFTWDLWEPLQKAQEMDEKNGLKSGDP